MKPGLFFKKLAGIFIRNRKILGLGIIVLCCCIAGLDSITPPEVPVESLYAFPIYLALNFYGWYFGLGITILNICFFTVSNFVIGHDSSSDIGPSIFLSLVFFLLFARGAYQFILNQRQLVRAQRDLQTKLEELEKLYQDSQLLHQQNLKLVVSEERNRLARDIHDVLAQGLAAIIFQVEAAFANRDKPEVLEERLTQVSELAHQNLQEARRSVANLRPLQLDGTSLSEALQQRVEVWAKEEAVQVKFSTSGQIQPLSNDVERALYRISQEALNNVARHAAASEAQVTLDYDEEEVCLTIQDNGKGFDREQSAILRVPGESEVGPANGSGPARNKFGLRTMEERATLIGGWATIQSKPGEGCRVRVIVPYTKALPVVYTETMNIATIPE
jgi:signal transduction histidine kinase